MNIGLIIEYIGTNYCGFQRQKNGITVQEVLENAIERATAQKSVITASGRTDTGVHAMGQVVNFQTNTTIAPEKLAIVINLHLPSDVRVLKSFVVRDDFNSRYDAVEKTYIYKVCNAENMSVFEMNRALHFPKKLDIKLMENAAKKLVGEHDFSSFMATGSSVKSTVRTIKKMSIYKEKDNIIFEITGNGFLYNMVRIIVGTLLDIGCGKKQDNIEELLLGGRRKMAGKTVGASGLYLKEVLYDKFN